MNQVFLTLIAAIMMSGNYSPAKKDIAIVPSKEAKQAKTHFLAANTWIVDEVFSNVKGRNHHYIRHGINTTGHDYGKFELTFNEDGTGTYTSEEGIVYTTEWRFTSADEHNMIMVLDNGQAFNWSMVEISKTSFQCITDLHVDGHDLLQSTRLVPVTKECEKANL